MLGYLALDEPRPIYTASDHVLNDIGKGTVHRTIQIAINFGSFVISGSGRNMSFILTPLTKGAVTVFASNISRFEVGNIVCPLPPPERPNTFTRSRQTSQALLKPLVGLWEQSRPHSCIAA